METRANHVLIGAFVIGVAVLALLSLLWAGKHSLEREFDHYDVYFREAVTGLTIGSPVQYNGIQIGEVRRLRLSRVDPGRVIVRIRVAGDTPIKQDTEAKLSYLGLTGVAFIQLSGGSVDAARLQPRHGRSVAVIRAKPSDLARLFESSTDIVTTVNDVLKRVATILSDENAEKLSQAIDDINRLTRAVGDEGDSLQTILREGANASRELSQTLVQVRGAVQRLDGTLDSAHRILDDDVAQAMAALREASVQVKGILSDNRGAIDQFARQGLGEIGPVLVELRDLLARLQGITNALDADPASYLLGRERIKEYEPP